MRLQEKRLLATGRRSLRRGIARRELIVAAAALGLGGVLLVLFLSSQRAASRRLTCEHRQVEIAKAIVRFNQYHGRFPGYREAAAVDAQGDVRAATWVFPLLPYVRYDDKKQHPGPYASAYEPYGPEGGAATRGKVKPTYIPDLVCPDHRPQDSSRRPDWLGFVVNCGMLDVPRSQRPPDTPADWPANGLFFDAFPRPDVQMSLELLEQLDGASQTIAISENVDCGGWTDLREWRVGFLWSGEENAILAINQRRGQAQSLAAKDRRLVRFARPSSHHQGGVNAAYATSASRFISDRIDATVWRQLMASDDTQARPPGKATPIWP